MTDKRPLIRLLSATAVTADAGVLQDDGTLWSHAATLGTRIKEFEFTIDQATVDNFVRVFTSGNPQKAPVDYEHSTTDYDPALAVARAQGKIPKAGDILEMQGVYSADDFTGTLKPAAEKLTAIADPPRELDDPRNFGLWIRWRPTVRALQAIQAREYTDLSIAFESDRPHNTTGEGQGPAILAVALVHRPFLDDMLPVAASQDAGHGGTPAAPGQGDHSMKNLLASLAAVTGGTPVATEEEAVQKVTVLGTEVKSLRDTITQRDRSFAELSSSVTALHTELGVSDPKQALEKVRQLAAENKRFADEAATQKKARIDGEVAAAMKKFEDRITPALRDEFYGPQLRAELEAGVEFAKSKTVMALNAVSKHGIVGRIAGGDDGSDSLGGDQDALLDKRARALIASDPELKGIADKDWSKAYDLACDKVAKEINYRSPQMERAKAATA